MKGCTVDFYFSFELNFTFVFLFAFHLGAIILHFFQMMKLAKPIKSTLKTKNGISNLISSVSVSFQCCDLTSAQNSASLPIIEPYRPFIEHARLEC